MSNRGDEGESTEEPDLRAGPMSVDDFLEYSEELGAASEKRNSLRAVGRVLDSRWMMAIAVLSVIVAIAWALQKRRFRAVPTPTQTPAVSSMSKVELLGVPRGAQITLDGTPIETTVFSVSAGVRHALEVRDASGGTWRQVFTANGPMALVVELEESVIEDTAAEEQVAQPPDEAEAPNTASPSRSGLVDPWLDEGEDADANVAPPASDSPPRRKARKSKKRKSPNEEDSKSSSLVRDPGF